jgi:hypothetical protein
MRMPTAPEIADALARTECPDVALLACVCVEELSRRGLLAAPFAIGFNVIIAARVPGARKALVEATEELKRERGEGG